eukprot:tig00020951_g16451.t1
MGCRGSKRERAAAASAAAVSTSEVVVEVSGSSPAAPPPAPAPLNVAPPVAKPPAPPAPPAPAAQPSAEQRQRQQIVSTPPAPQAPQEKRHGFLPRLGSRKLSTTSALTPAGAPEPAPRHELSLFDPARQETRVVRVFLSSTFQDMGAERDAIRALATPPLKALVAAERALFCHVADLRWGITDEAARAGDVVLLCLKEIARCTHFVAFIKGRYGWHRDDEKGPSDAGNALLSRNLERAQGKYPWIAQWADRSVTEAARGRCAFYFADEGLAAREAGAPEGPRAAYCLAALRDEIRRTGLPVREYGSAEGLADAIRGDLLAMVEREHPAGRHRSWLDGERAAAAAFAASRQARPLPPFHPPPPPTPLAPSLCAYCAAGGPEAMLVTGDGGCGKSALLANWWREWAATRPDDLALVHFVGASQSSSLLASLARRLSEEVCARWPHADPLDHRGSDADVAGRLAAWLDRGAREWPARVVLAVDGLDQMLGDAAATGLAWLPHAAGPRLRLVLSALPGPALEAAAARPHLRLELRPLTLERRRRLAGDALALQGRALSGEHLERLASAAPCANALFLTVLLEELSNMSVHANLDADLWTLLDCGEPVALYRRLLFRLGRQHGARTLQDAAGALACARHGMAEAELAAFLNVGAPGGPNAVAWSLAWSALLPHLVCRDGLYSFFHRCTTEAVEEEYGLRDASAPARRHRRAEEGPWALARAGPRAGERLAGLLSEPDVLTRLDDYELASLWLASGRGEEAASRYAATLGLGRRDADASGLLRAGELLSAMGRPSEGLPFVQSAVAICRVTLSEEHPGTAAALNSLGNVQREVGNLPAARRAYEEALAILGRTLGAEDPAAATCMNSLGLLVKQQGDLDAAALLYEQALRVQRRVKGPEHPETAKTLQNYAVLLREKGDLPAARAAYEASGAPPTRPPPPSLR